MNRQEKIEHIRKGRFFAWGDAAVFAAAFLLVAAFTLFAFLGRGGAAASFYLYYENEKNLTPEDYNIIEVSDGTVRVREADCPDGICIFWGAVSSGEINCLPHRFKIALGRGGGGTDL